jgi:hypothetical protein
MDAEIVATSAAAMLLTSGWESVGNQAGAAAWRRMASLASHIRHGLHLPTAEQAEAPGADGTELDAEAVQELARTLIAMAGPGAGRESALDGAVREFLALRSQQDGALTVIAGNARVEKVYTLGFVNNATFN